MTDSITYDILTIAGGGMALAPETPLLPYVKGYTLTLPISATVQSASLISATCMDVMPPGLRNSHHRRAAVTEGGTSYTTTTTLDDYYPANADPPPVAAAVPQDAVHPLPHPAQPHQQRHALLLADGH
jgi:hypothetical protein